MSRRHKRVPSYGLHKATGQARIVVGGQSIYLGKYGSPESRERYLREVARLTAGVHSDEPSPLKVHQSAGYLGFAATQWKLFQKEDPPHVSDSRL